MNVAKQEGGGGARGLFVVRLSTAKAGKVSKLAGKLKFAKFASSNKGYVCKGACKHKHMIFLLGR